MDVNKTEKAKSLNWRSFFEKKISSLEDEETHRNQQVKNQFDYFIKSFQYFYKQVEAIKTGERQKTQVINSINSEGEFMFCYCVLGALIKFSEDIPVECLGIPRIVQLYNLVKPNLKADYDLSTLLAPFNSPIKQNILGEFISMNQKVNLIDCVIRIVHLKKFSNPLFENLKELIDANFSISDITEIVLMKLKQKSFLPVKCDIATVKSRPVPQIPEARKPRPEDPKKEVPGAPRKRKLSETMVQDAEISKSECAISSTKKCISKRTPAQAPWAPKKKGIEGAEKQIWDTVPQRLFRKFPILLKKRKTQVQNLAPTKVRRAKMFGFLRNRVNH